MSENRITLGPPRTVIVFSVAAIAAGSLFLVWTLYHVHELTAFGAVLMGSAVVLFLLAGLDGIQRRYVIEKRVVRKRLLYLWRVYHLPPDVEVQTDPASQVLITSKADARVILKIPREYNRRDALAQRLRVLLGRS